MLTVLFYYLSACQVVCTLFRWSVSEWMYDNWSLLPTVTLSDNDVRGWTRTVTIVNLISVTKRRFTIYANVLKQLDWTVSSKGNQFLVTRRRVMFYVRTYVLTQEVFTFFQPNYAGYFCQEQNKGIYKMENLSLIHIWRCRRSTLCRSRWSPYH